MNRQRRVTRRPMALRFQTHCTFERLPVALAPTNRLRAYDPTASTTTLALSTGRLEASFISRRTRSSNRMTMLLTGQSRYIVRSIRPRPRRPKPS